MLDKEFQAILHELDQIKEDLAQDSTKKDDKQVKQKILDLRQKIDKCIGYWLQFEEKLWALQDKYQLDIPDQIDDSLISAYLGMTGDVPESEGEAMPKSKDSHKQTPDSLTSEGDRVIGDPQDPLPIRSFRRGLGYLDLSMLEEAILEFKQVVEQEPNLIAGHFFLGLTSLQKGDYDYALQKFRLILALLDEPSAKAVIYNTMGKIYAEKQEHEKAISYFLLACEEDASSSDYFYNCGASLFNLGKYEESVKYFRKAFQKSNYPTEDYELNLNLGKSLAYLGELEDALTCLKTALSLKPKSSEVHFELGVVYHLKQQEQLAKQEYQKAIKLHEEDKKGTEFGK